MATQAQNKAQDKAQAIQWTTVSEEPEELTKVALSVGDRFTARFTGPRTQENENGKYTQFRFVGGDGVHYFINPGYQLREAFKRVRPTNLVRITMMDERDTGKDSMMGIYQVEVARLAADQPIPMPVFDYADQQAEPPF